jgi:hypothetical protein
MDARSRHTIRQRDSKVAYRLRQRQIWVPNPMSNPFSEGRRNLGECSHRKRMQVAGDADASLVQQELDHVRIFVPVSKKL